MELLNTVGVDTPDSNDVALLDSAGVELAEMVNMPVVVAVLDTAGVELAEMVNMPVTWALLDNVGDVEVNK